MPTSRRSLTATARLLAAALLAAPAGLSVGHTQAAPSRPHALIVPRLPLHGAAPLHFEPHVGRDTSEVRFLARGQGYGLFLGPTGAILSLVQPRTGGLLGRLGPDNGFATDTVGLALLGADPRAVAIGLDRLAARSNYLVGPRRTWHSGLPNYGRVRFSQVYRGIDVEYYGRGGGFEYDFLVRPHADPARIRIGFLGAGRPSLDRHGNLVLQLAGGTLTQRVPALSQRVAGREVRVAGRFVLRPDGSVGLAIGSYDASLTLRIDPALTYASYLGGSGTDYGDSLAVDGQGNLYTAGYTASTNLTLALPQLSAAQYAAYSQWLQQHLWWQQQAPSAPAGVVIPFPTTPGAYRTAPLGGVDAFVAKFNPAGATGPASLVYSTYLGGSKDDQAGTGVSFSRFPQGNGIAVDAAGNAYVTGETRSTDFPTTAGAFQPAYGGSGTNGTGDAFVAKLNATGSGLLYGTYLGGSSGDFGTAITVHGGRIYVTGVTASVTPGSPDDGPNGKTFPVTNGTTLTLSTGKQCSGLFCPNVDAFVSELDPTLAGAAQLIYSTYLGANGVDFGQGIAVGATGDIYVSGDSASASGLATPGALQTTNPTGGGFINFSGFVARLHPTAPINSLAAQVVYATYLGGPGGSDVYGLAVDTAGDAYVTGEAFGSFPTTVGAFQTAPIANTNALVAKLNPAGSALLYATLFGATSGNKNTTGLGIALDSAGNAYITGNTGGPIPTTSGALPLAAGATSPASGAFVAEFIPNLAVPAPQQLAYSSYLSGTGSDTGYAIAVDANGFVSIAGVTSGGLPVTPNAFQSTYGGKGDAFVATLLPQPEAAPICTVDAVLKGPQPAVTLSAIAGVRPPGQMSFPFGSISYRNGAGVFVVRNPRLTCIRPQFSTAVVTLTGTISGPVSPPFQLGDTVTVTISLNGPAGPVTAEVLVTRLVNGAVTTVQDVIQKGTFGPPLNALIIRPF